MLSVCWRQIPRSGRDFRTVLRLLQYAAYYLLGASCLEVLEQTTSDGEGTLSDHSVSLIKNLIGGCQKDHGEAGICLRDIGPAALPTRVIDV